MPTLRRSLTAIEFGGVDFMEEIAFRMLVLYEQRFAFCNSRMTASTDSDLAPRKHPRQARSQATVGVILDTTARILVELGFARLTTNVVAERAGISVGSLYQYFPNKGALVEAVRKRHSQRMEAAVLCAFEQPDALTFDAAMSAAIEAMADAHLIEPDLHQALEQQLRVETVAVHDRGMGMVVQRLMPLLSTHRGASSEKSKLVAYVLTQAVHALIHVMCRDKTSRFPKQQMIHEISRLARGYLSALE